MEHNLNHPLLNKRVRIILARKDDLAGEQDFMAEDIDALKLSEDQYIVGKLIRITNEGDFDIRLDDGSMRYCWPALEIIKEEE